MIKVEMMENDKSKEMQINVKLCLDISYCLDTCIDRVWIVIRQHLNLCLFSFYRLIIPILIFEKDLIKLNMLD